MFASNRTGAATAVTRQDMALLPTISNRMESFVRLTPAMGGNMSFAGQDNRMNNITVDGSYFNNSFGLGGQPGDRTNVAPISMDAIEQIQVNVAPFDVRSGNFVGAGVNSVTRSGTNNFRGSGFYQFRDNGLVGKEAKGLTVNPGTFDFTNYGGWGAGPIIKNRLFFFGNAEKEEDRAARHHVPRQQRRRDGRRQHHPRAVLGPRHAERVSRSSGSTTRPGRTRITRT